MSEDTEAAKKTTESTSEKVTDTAKTEDSDIDFGSLPDDKFEKVFDDPRLFKHNRFKELREKAREADKLKTERQKAEEAKMAEEGKFKELLAQRETELEQFKSNAQRAAVDNKLQQHLFKAGVVDADTALAVIDRSAIKVDDDGNVKGIEKAVEALKTSKTFLFGNQNASVGTPTNPKPGAQIGTKTYKRSYLRGLTAEQFQKEQADIEAASRAGTIIDDISQRPI